MRESDLYVAVRDSLQNLFADRGECHLWVSAEKVSDEVKRQLDDSAVSILETEDMRPDLVGYVDVRTPQGYADRELVVVEVKRGLPKIKDIFQLKMYAEALSFSVRHALLVSGQGFDEARRRFLIKRSNLLSYAAGCLSVVTLQILPNGTIIRDKQVSQSNPFEPKK